MYAPQGTNAQGQTVRFDPDRGYTLLFYGAWPDDVSGQCLHTASHAENPRWATSCSSQDLGAAEANRRADGRCKTCLPAIGDLP